MKILPIIFKAQNISPVFSTLFQRGIPGILVFTLLLPDYASAQGSGATLEEVVVTARKREESLQDTPISITVFSASDLQARNLDTLYQIAESTPNLVFNNSVGISGSSAASTIFIRGIGQLDFTLNVDAGVGLYVDGVYISRSVGSLIDLLEVERVEVLRGPQGTLFGRNTIGGAVNITSKQPEDEFSGKLGITGGSFDRIEGYGSVNLPISDTLKNRTSIKVKKRDSYYTRLQDGADAGNEDSFAGRTVFNWQASDDLDVDFALDGTREREGMNPQTLLGIDTTSARNLGGLHNAVFSPILDPSVAYPFGPNGPPSACLLPLGFPGTNSPACYNQQWITSDPYETNASYRSISDLDLWGVSGTITWGISDNLTLKSITAYRDVSTEYTMDMDGSPINIFAVDSTLDNDAFSQEFQALGTAFDNKLDWITGFYYLYEDGLHKGDIVTVFGHQRSGGVTTTESIAAFSQGTWHFNDKLALTAGLRYTKDERVWTPNNEVLGDNLGPLGLPGQPVGTIIVPHVPFTVKASEPTPMVNLSYNWTDDLMTYFSYSEGFKGGGFTERVVEPVPAASSFDPEFVKVYEAGFKFTGMDNRLRLNGSAFFNDYTDMHVFALQPGVLGAVTTNAGEAEVKGFELELSLLPVENWLIQAGVGYLDGEYTSLAPNVPDLTLDSELVNMPEWSLNASTSYDFNFADGTLEPRLDWSYRSEVSLRYADNPLLRQEGYHLINASLAYETSDGKWRSTVIGKNLTDEDYLVSGSCTSNFCFGTYAMPRTWAINVERRF